MRGRDRWSLLGSLPFAGSIGLLVLNDHVLKSAWPGVVTGKLSDIAGVVMVAIAMTALTGCRRLSLVTTALAFSMLKTLPAVAVLAAPVLGGVTRTDPTDLIALLALLPTGRWLATRLAGESPATDSLAVRVVLIGAAVFATTATSCAPGGVWSLGVVDGVAHARVDADVWIGRDGGARWERSDSRVDDSADFDGEGERCAADRCFEITYDAEAPRVVETTDGRDDVLLDWDRSAAVALDDTVDWSCGTGSLDDLVAVEHGGGVAVIVSMTEAGTLRWTSATGSWAWVAVGGWGVAGDGVAGFPVAAPAAEPGWIDSGWPTRATYLLITVGAVASIGWVARLARSRHRQPVGYALAIVPLVLISLVPLAFVWLLPGDWRVVDGREQLAWATGFGAVVGALVAGVAALAARPRRSLPSPDASARVG